MATKRQNNSLTRDESYRLIKFVEQIETPYRLWKDAEYAMSEKMGRVITRYNIATAADYCGKPHDKIISYAQNEHPFKHMAAKFEEIAALQLRIDALERKVNELDRLLGDKA